MNMKHFCMAAASSLVAALSSCGSGNSETTVSENAPGSPASAVVDTAQTAEGEWTSLFDGKTFNGWHGFNKKGQEIKNWMIEDSSLVCLGAAKDAHGGDIVSDASFGNFELSWDWKLTKGANSGVMYHVIEGSNYLAPYETGPEYQVIDDIGFPEKLEDWQKAGADYAMTPAGANKKVNPVGEWNSSRIIYRDGHVEHWLNDEKVVEFDRSDPEWKKQRENGKWKDYPDYGKAGLGPFALQDHGNKVYFKNIKVRLLK